MVSARRLQSYAPRRDATKPLLELTDMLVDDAKNLRLRCHPLEVHLNWGLHGFTHTLIFCQKKSSRLANVALICIKRLGSGRGKRFTARHRNSAAVAHIQTTRGARCSMRIPALDYS